MKRGSLLLSLFLVSILVISGCDLRYSFRDSEIISTCILENQGDCPQYDQDGNLIVNVLDVLLFLSSEMDRFTGHVNATIQIQNVDIEEKTLDIHLTNDGLIGGFQFELFDIGIIETTTPEGFMGSNSENMVLVFSMTGATISTGSGVLTTVSFSNQLNEGDQICFGTNTNNNVLSDSGGSAANTIWGDCYLIEAEIEGCTDSEACNYDSDSSISCGSEGEDDNSWFANWMNPAFPDSYGNTCESFINAVLENNLQSSLETVCGTELSAPAFLNLEDYFSSCESSCYELIFDVCYSACQGSCCSYTEDCSGNCGGDLVNDCEGVCGGEALEDFCGICDSDSSNDCEGGVFEHYLHDGSNLISFPILPVNNSVENVFESLDSISVVINEGGACHPNPDEDLDGWIGCISHIVYDRGYWIILGDDETLTLSGIPAPEIVYSLHDGANLISYPLGSQLITDAIPEDHCIESVITAGTAGQFLENFWTGSLMYFEPGKGYWVITSCDFDLTFEQPITSNSGSNKLKNLFLYESQPSNLFPFSSSTEQAFYFIPQKLFNFKYDDVLVAYNIDTGEIIGSVIYEGQSTIVVPAMGMMGYSLDPEGVTSGYANSLSEIGVKIYREGKMIDFNANIPPWENNRIFMIEQKSGIIKNFLNFIYGLEKR